MSRSVSINMVSVRIHDEVDAPLPAAAADVDPTVSMMPAAAASSTISLPDAPNAEPPERHQHDEDQPTELHTIYSNHNSRQATASDSPNRPNRPDGESSVPPTPSAKTVVLPSAPGLSHTVSASQKRPPPSFLASFNSHFAYSHRDVDVPSPGPGAKGADTKSRSNSVEGRHEAMFARAERSIPAGYSHYKAMKILGRTGRELPMRGQGLVSEPPSLASTPEMPKKRLAVSTGDHLSTGASGGGDANSSQPHRRTASTPRNLVDGLASPTNGDANAKTNPTQVVQPTEEWKKTSPTAAQDGDPAEPTLVPITRLRFNLLFLILTVIQVTICCVVVWYLGDRNARSIVDVLSRQIRSDVLSKVQFEITSLLVDCLSAANHIYSAIESQPSLIPILREETSVTQFNASYLFPIAITLAKFSTLPQCGYITPRGLLIFGRRPHLLAGYMGQQSTASVSCAIDNDGSNGCFFQEQPIFNSLVADPDEIHEYHIQEVINTTRVGTNNLVMTRSGTLTPWKYNRLEHLRLRGDPEGSIPWTPFNSESDFRPTMTGPEVSSRLQDYTDLKYAEAIRLGTQPLPDNSTTTPYHPFTTNSDVKSRVVYSDSILLNGELGWTRTFLGASNQVVVAAVRANFVTNVSDGVGFTVFSNLYYNSMRSLILENIKTQFTSGETNSIPNGEVFIFERSGLLVASTLDDLDAKSQLVVRTNILTTDHYFVSSMRPDLVGSGLISTHLNDTQPSLVNVSRTSSSASRAYSALMIDESFRVGGDGWHMRAAAIPPSIGLEWVVVVVTLDSDFTSGFRDNSISTGYWSAIVGVLSILVTLAVVQMLTRPLMKLVSFMQDIVWRLVESKDDLAKQASDLSELRTIWQRSIEKPSLIHGNVDDELAALRRTRRRAIKRAKERQAKGSIVPGQSAQDLDPNHTHETPSRSTFSATSSGGSGDEMSSADHSDSGSDSEQKSTSNGLNGVGGVGGVGGSGDPSTDSKHHHHHHHRQRSTWWKIKHSCCVTFPKFLNRNLPNIRFKETQLLHQTFGAMLNGLHSSHDLLQTANESKRRFIRYIFHEVRVPFNAIVLGVEQLREDLYTEPLRPVEEMQDVVNILNEQSKVVARILNDVLSLQKIEDGALQLEMAPFNMIELVCGTLRSFQPLFAEKNLVLMTEMENIDQAIWRLNKQRSLAEKPKSDDRRDDRENAAPSSIHAHGAAPAQPPTPSTVDRTVPNPLSTVIAPSTGESETFYLNAYEDSKELQRFAESCSREVMGDRYRLRQVLANFLSNAVKFTPAGGTVIVKVGCSFPDDGDSSSSSSPPDAHTGVESTLPGGMRLSIEAPTNEPPPTNTSAQALLASIGSPTNVDSLATPTVDGVATPHAVVLHVAPHTPVHGPSSLLSCPPPPHVTNPSFKVPKRVRMHVSVADTGRGLSAAELKQMFKPYVQFKSGEQQQGKGTGLGLNISQSLIHLHGGEIGVTSAGVVGQGCTFWFELPMEIVPLSVSHTSKASSPIQPLHQIGRERSTSQLTRTTSGSGATTTSAAALAVASMFNPAESSLPPSTGLRMWHSPRSPQRGLAPPASQDSPPAVTFRRVASQTQNNPSLDENGNYVDLIPDRPQPYVSLGTQSSPTTPLLARGVFRPAASNSARRASRDGLSNTPTNSGAAFTSIVPTGGDVTSNLQYMSQLTFLNELALQGQNTTPVSISSHKVSPLQQYRSTVLAQNVPYGVGYSARPLPPPIPAVIASAVSLSLLPMGSPSSSLPEPMVDTEVDDDTEATFFPPRNPLAASVTRAAVTPTSSPLPASGVGLSTGANGSVIVPSVGDLDQAVFSTSPFGKELRHVEASSSPTMGLDSVLNRQLNMLHQQQQQQLPPQPPQHQRYPSHGGGPHRGSHSRQRSGDGSILFPPSPMIPISFVNSATSFVPSLTPVVASPANSTTSIAASKNASPTSITTSITTPPTVTSAPTATRPRVLVVEDSVPNRKLLMMLLRALKCEAVGVENGLLAVHEFEPTVTTLEQLKDAIRGQANMNDPARKTTSDYAIVLMDGNMPVLDGISATRAIRSLGFSVPICAVTGNALDEDTESFLRAGANEVLAKPVQRAALERVLTRFLPNFHVAGSVAQAKINEQKNK